MDLLKGQVFKKTIKVSEEVTAKSVKSGLVDVFATPMMIALVEDTASTGVQSFLDEGMTTVGTLINMTHQAATPVGMEVIAEVTVTEIDGRKICFDVVCKDEKDIIGIGKHERFIVNLNKFNSKANAKK